MMSKEHKKINKKGGFTLIEVIAALAIMAIMIAVVTPKITRYIHEAKKVKALEEVRQVVMAVNTYNMEHNDEISSRTNFGGIKQKLSTNDIIDLNKVKSIKTSMTLEDMEGILDGNKNFTLSNEGYIDMGNDISYMDRLNK